MNANGTALAALFLACFGILPAVGADLKGRIQESNGRRLVRPADGVPVVTSEKNAGGAVASIPATPLRRSGALTDSSFELQSANAHWNIPFPHRLFEESLAGGSAEDELAFASRGEELARSQLSASAPRVDYAAIERAYAQLGSSALRSALAGGMPTGFSGYGPGGLLSGGVYGPTGRPLGAGPQIDVDNCACGTPIPTTHCFSERSSPLFNHPNPTPGAFRVVPTAFSRYR